MSELVPVNVGSVDKVVRVVVGLALLSLLAIGPVPGWGLVGLLGLVLLATAAMGRCPLYVPLGLSTAGKDEAEG